METTLIRTRLLLDEAVVFSVEFLPSLPSSRLYCTVFVALDVFLVVTALSMLSAPLKIEKGGEALPTALLSSSRFSLLADLFNAPPRWTAAASLGTISSGALTAQACFVHPPPSFDQSSLNFRSAWVATAARS
jgi:hypothetical protein